MVWKKREAQRRLEEQQQKQKLRKPWQADLMLLWAQFTPLVIYWVLQWFIRCSWENIRTA